MLKKLSLFVFLISCIGLRGQNSVIPEDLKSPQSTVYTFTHYANSDDPNYRVAGRTLKGVFGETAADKAEKLSKILQAKGLKLDISKIPSDPNFTDTISGDITNRYVLFPNRMPDIYVEKLQGNSQWFFSQFSVDEIDLIYKEVFPYGTDWIQDNMPEIGHKPVLGIELWQLAGLMFLLIGGLIFNWILRKIISWILSSLESHLIKYTNEDTHRGVIKLSKPLTFIIVIFLIEKFLPSLQLPIDLSSFLFTGFDFAYIVFWVSFFLTLVQIVSNAYLEYANRTDSKLDDQLVPVINNVMKGVVILAGILKILTVVGVNPTSVLAGASIGGLALALSAQDTVKNLLGSFMIFMDKPFQIGDWIEAGTVVGSVEQVGFRSTRIRAADTSIFQIPNNQLAELIINNKGMRKYRRYTTTLGVRYDTPPVLMQNFIDGIRELVVNHQHTLDDKYNVEFEAFGASSLDIYLNVYFVVLDWNELQRSKHALHMSILTLANEMGVSFAFPSQTVMIEQFPDKTTFDMNYDTGDEKYKKALDSAKTELKDPKNN